MTQIVRVSECAVAHGSLSIVISATAGDFAAGPVPREGRTVEPSRPTGTGGAAERPARRRARFRQPDRLVKALNAVGATPLDLLAILQAMKAAGALKAELEII